MDDYGNNDAPDCCSNEATCNALANYLGNATVSEQLTGKAGA